MATLVPNKRVLKLLSRVKRRTGLRSERDIARAIGYTSDKDVFSHIRGNEKQQLRDDIEKYLVNGLRRLLRQPPTEQPPTEQPPTEQPPTEQPPTEQPPTEQPPTERKHNITELAQAMIVELWSFCPELMKQVCCANPWFPYSDDPLSQLDSLTFQVIDNSPFSDNSRLEHWACKALLAVAAGVPDTHVSELLPEGRADLLQFGQWSLHLASLCFEKGKPEVTL